MCIVESNCTQSSNAAFSAFIVNVKTTKRKLILKVGIIAFTGNSLQCALLMTSSLASLISLIVICQ